MFCSFYYYLTYYENINNSDIDLSVCVTGYEMVRCYVENKNAAFMASEVIASEMMDCHPRRICLWSSRSWVRVGFM